MTVEVAMIVGVGVLAVVWSVRRRFTLLETAAVAAGDVLLLVLLAFHPPGRSFYGVQIGFAAMSGAAVQWAFDSWRSRGRATAAVLPRP